MPSLGAHLRETRRRLGLTLRDVEERCGVSNAYLSMIESGNRKQPHPNILKKLASAYGEDVQTLLKLAGYLELSEEEADSIDTEALFREALADPGFRHGTRLPGNISSETKKFIAEMYRNLKEKRRGSKN